MAHDFTSARVVAQHCAELVARGPHPQEREAQISAWRRDLALHLAQAFSSLLATERLTAEISAPEWLPGSTVLERIGPVAANSLLRCGTEQIKGQSVQLLLSLDHATALALAERSFGGEGRVGEPSHDPLPRSSVLLSDEVASQIAAAIARARQGGDSDPGDASPSAEVVIRSESAARLRPFDPAEECALLTVCIADHEGCEWQFLLSCAGAQFQQVLPPIGGGLHRIDHKTGMPTASSPGGLGPFGAIPLSLCAVLTEFELTLSQLDRLALGDVIPLAMPGAVPLRVGDALLGHGRIGTLDDRMALRLTDLGRQGCSQ